MPSSFRRTNFVNKTNGNNSNKTDNDNNTNDSNNENHANTSVELTSSLNKQFDEVPIFKSTNTDVQFGGLF